MSRLPSARALVTGAAGFIGSHIVRALIDRGAEVHSVVRPGGDTARLAALGDRAHIHRADVATEAEVQEVMRRARPEVIFHLAVAGGSGTSPDDRLAATRVNVLGTACVLEAAGAVGYERFVHAGSAMEYGPSEEPIPETHPIAPTTYRGVTKAAATLLAQHAARSEGRPIVVLRPFCVYGPGGPKRRLIPTAIRAVLDGETIDLTASGYRRDYVYVDDVVDAFLLAAEADTAPGEVLNVGSGQQWANEEVVDLIQRICGRTTSVSTGTYVPRPYDRSSWVADIAEVQRVLGWSPRHDLEGGLRKTVDFIRSHARPEARA